MMEVDPINNETSKEKQHYLLVKDYKKALKLLNKEGSREEGKKEITRIL